MRPSRCSARIGVLKPLEIGRELTIQEADFGEKRQQWVDAITKKFADDFTESEIVNWLVQKGFNRQIAREIVRDVATRESNAMSKAGKRKAPWQIILGSVLITVGVVVPVVQFINDTKVVIIWYGIILVGIGFLGRGIWKMHW